MGLETANLIFLVYVVKQGYGCKMNMRKYTTYTQKILKTQIKAKVILVMHPEECVACDKSRLP